MRLVVAAIAATLPVIGDGHSVMCVGSKERGG